MLFESILFIYNLLPNAIGFSDYVITYSTHRQLMSNIS